MLLRTGTVRGPAVAVSRGAQGSMIKWNALEAGVLIELMIGLNRISAPGVSGTARGFSHAPNISENFQNLYWPRSD
jgi:hypothetical protein